MYKALIQNNSATHIKKEFHQHGLIPTHHTNPANKDKIRKAHIIQPNRCDVAGEYDNDDALDKYDACLS